MPGTAIGSDPLSDVLRSIRLSGAVFFDVEATAPWVVTSPHAGDIAGVVMPGAQHVLHFHAIARGRAFCRMEGEGAVCLEAGDVIVFPRGDGHLLSSAPELRSNDAPVDVASYAGQPLPIQTRVGAEAAAETLMICGFIGCDARPFNPLIECLPRMFVARAGSARESSLGMLADFALRESRRPSDGSGCVLERLSELMFIEAGRRYVASLPEARSGWLAGLRDPQLGAVLARIHERPGASWSLELLARAAGMSRTTFVERFTSFVGIPPMQYVTQWRIQAATTYLGRGDLSLAAVASMVGFESESAFNRAFKRVVGQPPGEFRRSMSAQPDGAPSPLRAPATSAPRRARAPST